MAYKIMYKINPPIPYRIPNKNEMQNSLIHKRLPFAL